MRKRHSPSFRRASPKRSIFSIPSRRSSSARTVTLKIGGQDMSFPGATYLRHFALANFYFHLTTAYDILRHNGLEIGKRDFMGSI